MTSEPERPQGHLARAKQNACMFWGLFPPDAPRRHTRSDSAMLPVVSSAWEKSGVGCFLQVIFSAVKTASLLATPLRAHREEAA